MPIATVIRRLLTAQVPLTSRRWCVCVLATLVLLSACGSSGEEADVDTTADEEESSSTSQDDDGPRVLYVCRELNESLASATSEWILADRFACLAPFGEEGLKLTKQETAAVFDANVQLEGQLIAIRCLNGTETATASGSSIASLGSSIPKADTDKAHDICGGKKGGTVSGRLGSTMALGRTPSYKNNAPKGVSCIDASYNPLIADTGADAAFTGAGLILAAFVLLVSAPVSVPVTIVAVTGGVVGSALVGAGWSAHQEEGRDQEETESWQADARESAAQATNAAAAAATANENVQNSGASDATKAEAAAAAGRAQAAATNAQSASAQANAAKTPAAAAAAATAAAAAATAAQAAAAAAAAAERKAKQESSTGTTQASSTTGPGKVNPDAVNPCEAMRNFVTFCITLKWQGNECQEFLKKLNCQDMSVIYPAPDGPEVFCADAPATAGEVQQQSYETCKKHLIVAKFPPGTDPCRSFKPQAELPVDPLCDPLPDREGCSSAIVLSVQTPCVAPADNASSCGPEISFDDRIGPLLHSFGTDTNVVVSPFVLDRRTADQGNGYEEVMLVLRFP